MNVTQQLARLKVKEVFNDSTKRPFLYVYQNFMTEILTDQSFISHKDLIERLGENLFSESWRKW
jgi:hypothetical protein